MFSLVQRGQLYADDNGWPVMVYDCNARRVVCRREDGRLRRSPSVNLTAGLNAWSTTNTAG